METPIIPIEMPEGRLNMTQLANEYGRTRRWLHNKFRENKIFDAIGEKKSYSLNEKQLLIAFILYEPPPGKYYRAYLMMERRGEVQRLIQLWGLEKFKASNSLNLVNE